MNKATNEFEEWIKKYKTTYPDAYITGQTHHAFTAGYEAGLSSKVKPTVKEKPEDSPMGQREKKKINILFLTRYEQKSKEITGNIAKLPWGGKEGKLLSQDYETHGYHVLVKYIEIFFSDKEPSVADFTRHRNKAGYSYSVFHGMLSKLSMSKVKPAKACSYCGRTSGHNLNCKIELSRVNKDKKEREELNNLKDEYKDFSFVDTFNKEIKNGRS